MELKIKYVNININVHPTKLRVKDFNYCFRLLVYLYFETLGIFLRLLPDREILQCAVHNIYAQKVPYLMNIVLCSNSRLCFATFENNAFAFGLLRPVYTKHQWLI